LERDFWQKWKNIRFFHSKTILRGLEMSASNSQQSARTINVNRIVLIHFFLACILAALIIPFFIFTDVVSAFEAAIKAAGITEVGTTYLDAVRGFRDAPGATPAILLFMLQPWTPTIAAFLVCFFIIKRGSAADLLSRYKPWRGVTWQRALLSWAIAFAVIAALSLLKALVRYYMLPDAAFEWNMPGFGSAFWMTLLATMFLDGGGLAEEGGWRGFAAPLLQSKYSPLKAAIILGALWGAWHIPVKIQQLLGSFTDFAIFYLDFTVFTIALTIIINYFSNRVGGSALMGVMLHGMTNDTIRFGGKFTDTSLALAAGTDGNAETLSLLFSFAGTLATLAVAIVLVVISKGKLAYTPQAAAPYVESSAP
jgi:uncharacterized protein